MNLNMHDNTKPLLVTNLFPSFYEKIWGKIIDETHVKCIKVIYPTWSNFRTLGQEQ